MNLSQWENLKLSKALLHAIEKAGFSGPTEIQRKCIPPILGGQQVIGIAQTGTGKTAAFLIPIISKLRSGQGYPRALILAPTKELVVQISTHFRMLAVFTDILVVPLYGGVGPKAQIESLEKGVDLIIATPGRFMELYLKGEFSTKHINLLVIDEADKMMDMNFMPQLRRIFEVLPSRRQNLLFSATFSPRIEKMSQEFLDFAMKIEITPQATAAKQVAQQQILVPNLKTKINLLIRLLEDSSLDRVIIFVRKKETADNLAKYLDRIEMGPVRAIHSNKGQNSRINAIRAFGEGKLRILIATDVAARGIDIEKVSHVVNFDVPLLYDDYIHRIGRTGRAFQTGISITFTTPADQYHISKIEDLIKEKIKVVKPPEGVQIQETLLKESQEMDREIDRQKKKLNPDFKGSFHEKKRKT